MNWITQKLNLKDFNSDLAEKISERYGIKQEDIQLIRKGLTPSDVKFDKEEKSSVDYITTRTVDRDREFIIPSGVILDDYRKTPVVLWAHKYDSLPLGKNLWIKADKKGLIAKTQYHTRPGTMGEQVWNYRSDGFPLAKSIGFVPLEIIEKEDYDLVDWKKYGITKEELSGSERAYPKSVLLEYSDVPVPSNPDAIQLAINKGLMNDLVDISALGKAYSLEIVEDENAEVKAAEEAKQEEGRQEEGQEGSISKTEEVELQFELAMWDSVDGSPIGDPAISIFKEYFKEVEAITKPDTENYIHIAAGGEGKHDGHKIRTITISAAKGIKAHYCTDCKAITGYLFETSKFTHEEAQAWVDSHKPKKAAEEEIECECPECGKEFEGTGSCSDMMCPDCEVALGEKGCSGGKRKPKKTLQYAERWNPQWSRTFDVAAIDSSPSGRQMKILCAFLECKVKEVFSHQMSIGGALVGPYLTAFKNVCSNFDWKDTRNFSWDGEYPPVYESIQVNRSVADDFLVDGTDFYTIDETPVILSFQPTWYGINVTAYTARKDKDLNKKIFADVEVWLKESHPLKMEKFSISGEFINFDENIDWKDLILSDDNTRVVSKIPTLLNKNGKNMNSRGVLMVGKPGTGKTMTGKILMNKSESTFIWISARDLGYGYKDTMKSAFKMGRDLAPSILFFEDIDHWLSDNSSLMDMLKTELDGVATNKGIVTMLTSNAPEKLPDALLDRPGRFHDVLLFDLPDSKARTSMISGWAGVKESDDLLSALVTATEGFSGAHMRELVEFAKTISEDEELDMGNALIDSLEKLSDQRELIQRLREKVKSVDTVEIEPIEICIDEEILKSPIFQKGVTTMSEAKEIAKDILNREHLADEDFDSKEWVKNAVLDLCRTDPVFRHQLPDLIVEKSGRVISDKNRRLIQSVIDSLTALIGITNDEPKEEEAKELEIVPEPVFTKEEKTMEVSEEMLTSVVSGTLKELLGLDKTLDLDELVQSRVSYAKGKMTA